MAGKKYREAAKQIDLEKRYPLEEALRMVAANKVAKFDETVEIAVRLNVDPRQADQNVRGTVVLPNGTGKVSRVLVLAKGEKEREAREAGADFVGGEDLIKRIQEENWLDFDRVIATPDIMGAVGRIGKILGPRGLMPNPRVGTVTFDVAKAVGEVKAGKVDYRVDKAGRDPRAYRQDQLRRGQADGKRACPARRDRAGQAGQRQGQLRPERVGVLDHGARREGRSRHGAQRGGSGAKGNPKSMRKEQKTALVAEISRGAGPREYRAGLRVSRDDRGRGDRSAPQAARGARRVASGQEHAHSPRHQGHRLLAARRASWAARSALS